MAKAQNNPLFVEIKKIEVQKAFNEKWDGKLPTQYIGSDNVTSLMGVSPALSK